MPTYPPQDAGPTAVRDYILSVLTNTLELSQIDAQPVANMWEFGRERHLSAFSEGDFSNLFGRKIGPYLYECIADDMTNAWRASIAGKINLLVIIGIPVTILLIIAYQWLLPVTHKPPRETPTEGASSKQTSKPHNTMAIESDELFIWSSGPILLFCRSLEKAHRTSLGGNGLFVLGMCLCVSMISAIRFTWKLEYASKDVGEQQKVE